MEQLRRIDLKGRQREAWHYLSDSKTTEIFYGGGAGGGKSFLGCLWHIDRRVRYPGTRGLIGRAKINNLEQSTLITFFKVCAILGHQQGKDFNYNSQKHIILWSNGSLTILKDLFLYPSDPDFISLGSTEYTDAFIDEGTEVSQRAFDLVATRIRWMLSEYSLIPKILVTCNPGEGWIKDNYVEDPETSRPISLKQHQRFVFALVDDNPDKQFVAIYRQQLERSNSDYDKDRLLRGLWDAIRDATNPFAHQFHAGFHTSGSAIYQRDKQLYISIDFNLNPFAVTFWHFWQDSAGVHLHGIDEAEIENGSVPAMIDLIKARYGNALHSCILTGDAMGNRRDISRRDNASHYLELKKGLGLSEHQIKVPANPSHKDSRTDVNELLWLSRQEKARYHFLLNSVSMKWTIHDFKKVQCDAYGEILKKERRDLTQRADYLDTARNVINTLKIMGQIRLN